MSKTEAPTEIIDLSKLPPSNEELEPAMFRVVGFGAVQKELRTRDAPIMAANKRTQIIFDRESAKKQIEYDQNVKDGLSNDDSEWPEPPDYRPCTSYMDLYEELPVEIKRQVLVEVARERSRRK